MQARSAKSGGLTGDRMSQVIHLSPYLRLKEAAEYLRVSKAHLYRLYNEGKIPGRSHPVVFHKDDLDAFHASQAKPKEAATLSRFQSARNRVRSLTTEYTANPTQQKGVG